MIIIEIFKLFGSIFIDNDKADASIAKTEKGAESLTSKLGSGIATAGKWAAGIAAGAVAVGGALLGIANKTGQAADRLLDLQDITGMTVEEIQRWEKVTKVAGVSLDAMTGASQKLTKSLNAMDSEGNKSRKAIESLGVSFKDIESMNADQRMDVLTKALAGVDDATERARIGTDLFGGSWKDIAPIVGLGAEAMDKAKASANIFSEEDLRRANDFRIQMDVMKDRVGFLAMEFGMKLLPVAEVFFNWIQDHMPQIEKAFEITFKVIEVVIGGVVKGIQILIEWLGSWKDNNSETITKIKESFTEFFKTLWDMIKSFVELATTLWGKYGDDITAIASKFINLIKTILETGFKIYKAIFDIFAAAFNGDWGRFWEGIKNLFSTIWNGIKDLLKVSLDLLISIFKGIGGAMFDAGKGMFNMVWDGLKSVWSNIQNWVTDKINWLSDKLSFWNRSSSQIESDAKKVQSYDSSAYNIPGYASGTNFHPGGLAIVGEKGPELLNLPRGSQVIPNGQTQQMLNQPSQINIENMIVRNDTDIKLIAKELYNLQKSSGRGLGFA